jgi:lipocalin
MSTLLSQGLIASIYGYLSRSPEVSDTLRNEFLETITKLGFALDDLVWL